jgi:hypothetical protein
MPGNAERRPYGNGAASNTNSQEAPDTESLAETADIPQRPDAIWRGEARRNPNSPEAVWRRRASYFIDVLVATGEPFSVDDLLRLAGKPPRGRQLSAAMSAAVRSGRIEVAGTQIGGPRARPRPRPVFLWRGVQ